MGPQAEMHSYSAGEHHPLQSEDLSPGAAPRRMRAPPSSESVDGGVSTRTDSAAKLGGESISRVSGSSLASSSIASTVEPGLWASFSAIGSNGLNRPPPHSRRRRRAPEQGEHSIDRAHGQMNLSVEPVINGPATVARQDPSAQYSFDSPLSDSALTYVGSTTSPGLPPTSCSVLSGPIARCVQSRSGWHRTNNPVIGLKGGSDTANGTSGWGPPPSTPNANVGGWGTGSSVSSSGGHTTGSGTGGGWGSVPGGNCEDNGPSHTSQPSTMPPTSIMKSTHASVSLSGSSPAPAAPSSTSTSTSWAAAAGKGLPVSEATPVTNHNNSSVGNAANPISTSKQFEKLNSVREALFSPDGWGGSHVKQDTSWDTEPRANAQDTPVGNAGARKDSGGPNNSSMWNGGVGGAQRNDGTDLWKSTLSGQPPPQTSKVQMPNNPWGNHTPQNPADFKTWGEEEDGGHSRVGGNGAPGPGGVSAGIAPPAIAERGGGGGGMNASHDSWKTGNTSPVAKMSNDWSKEPRSSWTESSHGSASRPEPLSDASGWGALPRASNSVANWGGGGGGGGGGMAVGNSSASGVGSGVGDMSHKWNDDQTKRMPEESSGIGAWGHNNKGPNGMNVPSGPSSHWKDMPSSNMMRGGGGLVGGGGGGVVGPPMGPGPNRHSHGVQPKESWGQIPPTSGKAWGDDGTSWNEEAVPGKSAINWTNNAEPGWNKPLSNRMRQSPPGGGWDENGGGGGPSFDNGPSPWSKVDGPGKPLSKDMIWNSKQFRILSEMGYRKDDIETALLQTQLRLDDALEMLNALTRANRHQVPPHVPDHVLGNNLPGDNPLDNPRVNLPFSPEVNHVSDSHYGSGNMLTRKMAPSLSASPTPGSGHASTMPISSGGLPMGGRPGSSSQPSPHQLRVLVQQIQMAVQAGHLNPQILNQPLAPQTLILLNQLLHQIKTLQGLQQQLNMARSGSSNNPSLMTVTVNITKTKQHISNLQNQISAQQANYLKGHVSLNPTSPLAHPQAQQQHLSSASGPGGPLSSSDPNAMQDMFHSLNLQNNLDNNAGNQGNANGGSRLAQWKLPKEPLGTSFPKAPGAANAKSGAPTGLSPSSSFLLEDNTWSRNSTDGGGGWPDSGKGGLNFDGSDFGIPEFEPGKPWKGTGLKNPDEDPNLTPGSVAPTALPLKSVPKGSSNVIGSGVSGSGSGSGDGGALTMTSPTWSFGDGVSKDPWSNSSSNTNGSVSNHSLTQIGQDLWGKSGSGGNSMMPGSNSHLPSSSPFNVGNNWSNNGWSNNQGNNVASASSSGGSNEGPLCLVLKNLTPQIDPSTLKTLCMQHGALTQFDVFPNHSTAVAVYRNGRDAVKAQKALNQCLLSNTAIHASTSSESDITAMLQRMGGMNNFLGSSRGSGGNAGRSSDFGQAVSSSSGTSSQQGGGGTIVPSSPSSSLVGASLMSKTVTTSSGLGNDMWSTGSQGGSAGPNLFNSSGSVWGAPEGSRTTTPLNSFLPGDLLGESGNP